MVFFVFTATTVTLIALALLFRNSVLLRHIRSEHEQQVKELDQTARTLVRRDFELSQTLETLRTMDEAKSHFVSVAAHQLRTPLSAIKWTLKLLLDEDLGIISPSQREFVSLAFQTNERMIRLINDLLDVSRIEGGRLEYEFALGAVPALIEEIVSSFKLSAKSKNLTLIFKKPELPPAPIEFDKEKVRMVLENLLENAIDYTPDGGQVSVELNEEPGLLRISVADTGIGIPEQDRGRIFAKFYRSAEAVKMFPNGTGLGLYICREIILRHGGILEIKSALGQGSTFSFTLPKKRS